MVDVSGIINRFKQMKQESDSNNDEFTDEVKDKQLTSLRKQRNKQINEMEKKRLRKVVNEYNMAKTRKELFGINTTKKANIIPRLTRKNSFLRDDKPLLKEKSKNVKVKFV